jgi:secretion/DNA translocation related CpaE-like protein
MTSGDADAPAVLVLSSDPALADAVRRLAAAAAVDAEVLTELPDVAQWQSRALVVVGVDLARRAAAQRPRRREVVLVSRHPVTSVWELAVALGADQVAVLPDADDWLVDRLLVGSGRHARARVVGVLGGCGGAGSSVLAAGLAVTAAQGGRRVLLVDLDPLGGGLDLALGLDGVPGLRWPDLVEARGRLPATSVHDSLPRRGQLAVLAWGRGEPVDVPARSVEAVVRSGARTHDLVVLDLPRSGDDVLLGAAARDVHELLLVVPARVRAAAAAAEVAQRWRMRVPAIRAVVRRESGDRLSARAVADAVQVPLALSMRDEPQVDAWLDRGDPPGLRRSGPLHRACEQWLAGPAAPARAA